MRCRSACAGSGPNIHFTLSPLQMSLLPNPTPYTLHPKPISLSDLCKCPCYQTLHPTPYTLNPKPVSLSHLCKCLCYHRRGAYPSRRRQTSSDSIISKLHDPVSRDHVDWLVRPILLGLPLFDPCPLVHPLSDAYPLATIETVHPHSRAR